MSKWLISHDDFVWLCRVESPDDWFDGYSVKESGVYVGARFENSLATADELRASRPWHPTGDFSEPALRFPCTLAELQEFLEEAGGYGSIDPFDMADFALEWIKSKSAADIADLQRELKGNERMDPLREEISIALAELGEGASTAKLMKKLLESAGKTGSCIKGGTIATGIRWEKSSGAIEICDRKAIQQRLKRLPKAPNKAH